MESRLAHNFVHNAAPWVLSIESVFLLAEHLENRPRQSLLRSYLSPEVALVDTFQGLLDLHERTSHIIGDEFEVAALQ